MKKLRTRWLGLTILFLSFSGIAQESPPALPGDVFSFQPGFDTLWGVAPLAYTNVIDAVTDDGYGLILDTTNLTPAFLNYKVQGNIYYPNGTILFYFAPNWSSVSQGGTGPGETAYFVGGGDWSSNSPRGLFTLYADAGGANLYFGGVGAGVASTYMSAPISWSSNTFHQIGLEWTEGDCELYLDGGLAATGDGETIVPAHSTWTNGFFIGSDNNGYEQARGAFLYMETWEAEFGGSLKDIWDAYSNHTGLNYNNQGFLTNVVFPDGSSITNQYDSAGRLTNRIDGAGNSVLFGYNNQGLVTSVNNANGQVMAIGYDAVNRPFTITDADGVTVTRTYDLLNRVIINTWPDTSTEQFEYSSNGLIAYTNQDSEFTLLGRDAAGRLTVVTNNLLETSQYGYDALDRLISLTDGLGNNTSWTYNQYGWLTSKSILGTPVITNGFDANGQLTTRWMPATGNTTYKWDAVGNLTNTIYPTRTNTYKYDLDNRLTNMADTNGADVLLSSFTYTPSGQLATETSPWGNDTMSFLYSQGRRTNLNLTKSGSSWNQGYIYDAAWRLTNIVSPAGEFAYGYSTANPASALFRTLDLPNSASISNYYDPLARLDCTALLNYWGHPLDGYSYVNDFWGLRKSITRQLGLTTNIVSVGYDGIGELASWTASETSGTARQNEQLGYAYDAANNLEYRTNGAMVQTFTVNSLNQIGNVTRTGTFTVTGATPAPTTNVTVNGSAAQTYGDFTFASTNNGLANGNNTFTIVAQNVPGTNVTINLSVNLPINVTFQYDINGNLTNDGTRSFSYDAENQLTNVSVPGAWQVSFLYDGLDRRRIERDYTWTNSAWQKTNETRFIYDGMQVIQERDANNNPQVTYTRGLDFSMSLNGAGGIGGLLARTDANGSTFFHADGNGNITALMDGNQNIVARYEYDPYGRLIGRWGTMSVSNKMRFSSMPYNDIAELSLYPFRAYEPNSQRWLNRDPIGQWGGMNPYRFVGNNPGNRIDPLGLAAEEEEEDGDITLEMLNALRFDQNGFYRSDAEIEAIEREIEANSKWVNDNFEPKPPSTGVGPEMTALEPKETTPTKPGQAANPCPPNTLPQLNVSASKYPQLADNIRNAQQAGYPEVLTAGRDAEANRAAALQGIPKIPGLSRDEYPFASSMEGGAGSWVGHIPVWQQNAQGAFIKNLQP